MNKPINSAPFNAWQVAQDAYLEAWSKIMIDLAQTENYSKTTKMILNNYLTLSSPFQEMLGKVMAQTLTTFNLPSRQDITNLSERLTKVEVKLDDIGADLKATKVTKKSYQKKTPLTNSKTLNKSQDKSQDKTIENK